MPCISLVCPKRGTCALWSDNEGLTASIDWYSYDSGSSLGKDVRYCGPMANYAMYSPKKEQPVYPCAICGLPTTYIVDTLPLDEIPVCERCEKRRMEKDEENESTTVVTQTSEQCCIICGSSISETKTNSNNISICDTCIEKLRELVGVNQKLPSAEEYSMYKMDISFTDYATEPSYKCPKCEDGGMCKKLGITLASYPPQYHYKCNKCGHEENNY